MTGFFPRTHGQNLPTGLGVAAGNGAYGVEASLHFILPALFDTTKARVPMESGRDFSGRLGPISDF